MIDDAISILARGNRLELASDTDRQTFMGELVEHVEHPVLATIVGAILLSLTSPPAQPRDEGTCVGEHQFKLGRILCGTAFAHRLNCRINLTDRSLGHSGIPAALRKEHQGYPFIAKARRPVERRPVASPFRQRFAMGYDSRFQLRRPALALPEKV